MKQIVIITVLQACEILKAYGMSVSPVHIHAGIDCGAYPFGARIQGEKQKRPVYEIYKPLLMQWINERSEEITGNSESEEIL